MALSPREFVEEVEKYFNIIEQNRKKIKNERTYHADQRVRLGSIDVSSLKEEIIEITISLHRLFIAEEHINNLSTNDTEKILKKARVIVLAGITESFKKYDNKAEDNFWQFYANDNDLSVNENFYKKILEPALIEENIIPPNIKGKINYTDYIARESELSLSCLEDVIYLFKFYYKYFYPSIQLKEFFKEINFSITGYKSQLEFLGKESLVRQEVENTYKRLSEFQGKAELVIATLVSFVDFINRDNEPLSEDNLQNFCEKFNKHYSEELSYIFEHQEIKNDFVKNISSIPEYKFLSILENLDSKEEIILPNGNKTTAGQYFDEEHYLGLHTISGKAYNFFPQCFEETDLTSLEDEKISLCGNKLFIKSKNTFIPIVGNNDSHRKAVKLSLEGVESFIWYDNRPLYETISVESDFAEIESLLPKENIISSLALKIKNEESAPIFELHLENFILISQENKGKRLELINTDQISMLKDFPIDDVCYTGEIVYPIKDKRPGKIDILLIADKEPIHLSEFEARINYELEDNILFDGNSGMILKPSPYSIKYGPERLFLFTTKRFDYKWLNDSCEVYECKNFGRFHVYEIAWLNTAKPLNLSIDSDYRWNFSECINFKVSQKFQAYRNNYVEYEINQLLDIDDSHITLSSDISQIEFKDISIRALVNSSQTSNNISMGFVNELLERDVNSNVIDKNFIQKLMPEVNLTHGRYDFEFYIKGSYLGRYSIFIIPNLQGEEYSNSYKEDEEVILTLKSQIPCFRNNKNTQHYKFDNLAACDFSINANKFIDAKKTTHYKKAKLFMPFTEINIKYEPEVLAMKFNQDGRLYASNSIDYYNLDKTSIIIKSPFKDARLKVNHSVVKPLIANNAGIIIEPLKSIKQYLTKNDNAVSIQSGKHELEFSVIWNSKVQEVKNDPFINLSDNSLNFSITYEGLANSSLKFIVSDSNNNSIDVKKVFCEDDFAPKFIRIDRNSFSIICDGKKWENRRFSIFLDNNNLDNIEDIVVKGLFESTNENFEEMHFKGLPFAKEIDNLNKIISTDDKNPYSFFERGILYSDMNIYNEALSDFEKSLKNSIDDEKALEYIQFFKENKDAIVFERELKKVGVLVEKFVLEELN
ncbi:MAG: hypothetical protein U0457_03995 [Candidatus Sericytochromatia bacterium]